jgi:hypothetical protein
MKLTLNEQCERAASVEPHVELSTKSPLMAIDEIVRTASCGL